MASLNASAIASTAAELTNAKSLLIVVDAIDLKGAAAVTELARATSAILTHARPDDIAAIQTQGLFTITAAEAVQHADALVIVGSVSEPQTADEGLRRLLGSEHVKSRLHLDTGPATAPIADNLTRIALPETALSDVLGALKAKISGAPVTAGNPATVIAEKVAPHLDTASYTVFAFPTGGLDRYALYALMALADTINAEKRAGLTNLFAPPGQSELTRMATSLTGLPPPLDFRSCRGLHDPLILAPATLIADGDIDLVVYISAANQERPAWLSDAQRLVTIAPSEASEGSVRHIPVGVAGVEHPALLEPTELASCIFVGSKAAGDEAAASSPGTGGDGSADSLPSAADVITALTQTIYDARGSEAPATTVLGRAL